MCIKNRSELLFCYDVTNANPNGDPLDENKPRIDEESKINIVTDVRLKRTIRDYLFNYKGYNGSEDKDIFVREIIYDKEGNIQDAKLRVKDFLLDKNSQKMSISDIEGDSDKKILQKMIEIITPNLLRKCIDIRLFGSTIPIEYKKSNKSNKETKSSITFTGPVQFKIGHSLHKVEIKHIKGTGAFASKAGAQQATFREEYILPYSFICFHGIINEVAAKDTKLNENDIKELLDAMWNGTKNLISRSKFGQMPRFLLKVTYKETENGFFIGDLDKKVKLTNFENEFKIRKVEDFTFDATELFDSFAKNKEKIEKIEYIADDNLRIKGLEKTNDIGLTIENLHL